jgi:glucose-6-phosphate isomerase
MINWNIRSTFSAPPSTSDTTAAEKAYIDTILSEEIGFFRLPENTQLIAETKKVFEEMRHKKYFIHIGIGGSALGPDMLLKAMGIKSGVKFVFLNNIDPDDMKRSLDKVNLKEAMIYVVSKSGTTAETVAAMAIMMSELKKIGVEEKDFRDYFVFCTDPEKGDLRKLQKDWNIRTLSIPSNVGGRYSVFTPVGLLPAMFAGIDAQALLDGARDIKKHLSDPTACGEFFALARWINDLHDKGLRQTVLMPYSSLLKEFSAWFVQLWAESLGKENKGLTPIPAYGVTDQHSQMQLFMEGPADKVLFMIEVESFGSDFSLQSPLKSESFKTLAPFKLSELMKAEFEGTLAALSENNRHVVHLRIPSLNESHLGQLILFSECLTVLVGRLLKVDPFNQPGVEAGKKYAYAWLKSAGK